MEGAIFSPFIFLLERTMAKEKMVLIVKSSIASADGWSLKVGEKFTWEKGEAYKGCPSKQIEALQKTSILEVVEDVTADIGEASVEGEKKIAEIAKARADGEKIAAEEKKKAAKINPRRATKG
jgi:hypothetical protein